jgi:hypothetical protein
MKNANYIENLQAVVDQAKQAEKHLKISYQRCSKI